MIIRRRPRHPARQIDQEADRELRHRRHEARPGPRHQHTRRGRGCDVDIADIDRAANEGAQLRKPRKNLAWTFGQAVGDDDIDIARGLDQAGRVQRVVAFMQDDLCQRPQAVQAALAVILAPGLGRMGQQNFCHPTSFLQNIRQ